MKTLLSCLLILAALTTQTFAAEDPDAVPLSKADVETWMRVQNALDGGAVTRSIDGLEVSTMSALGDNSAKNTFTVKQLRSYGGDYVPPKPGLQGKPRPPLWRFKLRETWSDVLAIEAPTDDSAATNKSYDDLKGAKFSWQRDLKDDSSTWIAQAAVILPLVFLRDVDPDEFGVELWGLMPSATINRLHKEADETADVDQLTLRSGGFVTLNTGWAKGFDTLVVRGAFAYQTDTGFDSSIPAGELEFEPRFTIGRKLGVGYRRIVWERKDREAPEPDANTILAYQARLRLRGEFGQYRRLPSGNGLEVPKDQNFLHLGGKAGITFAPFFHHRLTASADVSYMPSVSGPKANDLLFQSELALELWKFPRGPRGGISIKYINGGLGFDQVETETIYVGLSALF